MTRFAALPALIILLFAATIEAQQPARHRRLAPLPFLCTPDSARHLMRQVPGIKHTRIDSARVSAEDSTFLPTMALTYTGGNYHGVPVRETKIMFWQDSLTGTTFGFATAIDPTLIQHYEKLRAELIAELGKPSVTSAGDVATWRAGRPRSERRSRQDSVLFRLCMQNTIPLITRWDWKQNGRRVTAMLRADSAYGFVLGYYDTELFTERIPQFFESQRKSGNR